MSFGENLQFLRKRYEMTQEALAERLDVSRQSVSKWESNAAYPEMATILQLCDMFAVDMDTLLRGDVQINLAEDTAGYDRFMTGFAFRIAGAVAAILAGIALMMVLNAFGIGEMVAGAAFLCVIAVSVVVLIASGIQYDYFTKRYPVLTDFYTEEEKRAFHGKFIWLIAGGVGAILFGVALMCLFFAYFPEQEPYESWAVALFMLIIAGAVFCLILGGILEDKYDIEKYNRECQRDHFPTPEQRRMRKTIGAVWACGMVGATALFIVLDQSLTFSWRWNLPAILYPVAALLCTIITILIKRNGVE